MHHCLDIINIDNKYCDITIICVNNIIVPPFVDDVFLASPATIVLGQMYWALEQSPEQCGAVTGALMYKLELSVWLMKKKHATVMHGACLSNNNIVETCIVQIITSVLSSNGNKVKKYTWGGVGPWWVPWDDANQHNDDSLVKRKLTS